MKRYRWTSTTMEVTDVGGAYVTYAEHLRAMAELEERLKSAVADSGIVVGEGVNTFLPGDVEPICTTSSKPCSACGGSGNSLGMFMNYKQCTCCKGSGKLYTCRTCKDTGCPDCY